jgi:Mlc titration factor MtfA (ptsG expression regulator)
MEGFIICIILFCVVFLPEVLRPAFERFLMNRKRNEFIQHEPYYRDLIFRNISFFHRLDAAQQDKFLFRTFLFQRARQFHFVGVEAKPEMAVLIRAVAAQLTLGLDKFTLNYFRDI